MSFKKVFFFPAFFLFFIFLKRPTNDTTRPMCVCVSHLQEGDSFIHNGYFILKLSVAPNKIMITLTDTDIKSPLNIMN